MKLVFTGLIMFFSSQLFCKNWEELSARRLKSESFDSILFKKNRGNQKLLATGSAYNNAHAFEQLDFSKVPKWSTDEIHYAFSRIRDERFLHDLQSPKFPRRSSWLYPQDGCYARASVSAQRAGDWGLKRPSKVFVFGDLEVKTKYDKKGSVTWWYHVVPLVRDEKGIPIVLDPSIETGTYLTLTEWLERMGNVARMEIAICNTYTYGPMDSCDSSNAKTESEAWNDQLNYLPLEWNNLEELKLNPEKELGDQPPWSIPSLFGL